MENLLYFENSQIIGQPKIEYISENYLTYLKFWIPPHSNLSVGESFISLIINFILSTGEHFLIPLGISIILILYIPKYLNILHTKNLKFFFERKREYKEQLKEIWDEEFEKIKDSPNFSKFSELNRLIYPNKGRLSSDNNFETSILPYFHSHKIVEYHNTPEKGINKDYVDLTEKGLYFMEKYLEEIDSV